MVGSHHLCSQPSKAFHLTLRKAWGPMRVLLACPVPCQTRSPAWPPCQPRGSALAPLRPRALSPAILTSFESAGLSLESQPDPTLNSPALALLSFSFVLWHFQSFITLRSHLSGSSESHRPAGRQAPQGLFVLFTKVSPVPSSWQTAH